MLAVPTLTPGIPPGGDQWWHEVKWDGVRLMARTGHDRAELFNRTEGRVTVAYPELSSAGWNLPPDLHVDGEAVVVGDDGVPSFRAIGHRMHVRDPQRAARLGRSHPAHYMVFDLVRLHGEDLTRLPLHERRKRLEALDLPGRTNGAWQVPPFHTDGAALAVHTASRGLEGVVSKRHDSRYRPGERSPDWVKTPHRRELVAVIGAWAPQRESPGQLGAVWVGHPSDEETFHRTGLLYPLARVGSGLRHAARDSLLTVLRQSERDSPPFDPVPGDDRAHLARWVEPAICVQIRFLSEGDPGALRQPVMRLLRPEIRPAQAPYADLVEVHR